MKKLISAALATAILLSPVAAFKAEAQANCSGKLRIGFQGPLSGSESKVGNQILAAMKYEMNYFLKNSPTNLNVDPNPLLIDDQGLPEKATSVVPSFTSDPCLVGVVGPAYSGAAIASKPLYDQAGITVVSPSASSPSLSGGPNSYFFRLVTSYVNNYYEARDLINQLKPNAVVASLEYSYPNQLPLGNFKLTRYVYSEQTDLSQLIATMKILGVNVVFFDIYPQNISEVIRNIRENLPDALLIFNIPYENNINVQGLSNLLDGAIFFPGYLPIEATKYGTNFPRTNEFPIGANAGETIDATYLFLTAIQNGNTSRDAIYRFIRNINYSGYSGPLKFNSNGERDNYKAPRVMLNNGIPTDMLDPIAFANTYEEINKRKVSQIDSKTGILERLKSLGKHIDDLLVQIGLLQKPNALATEKLVKLKDIQTKLTKIKTDNQHFIDTVTQTPYFYFMNNSIFDNNYSSLLADYQFADESLTYLINSKVTISCIKGKVSKKVTGIKPTCPTGYKKK